MISNKFIFDKANQTISGGNLSETTLAQISSLNTLNGRSVLSVATLAALPNVVQNLGRLVYVAAENKYYYSDGVTWNINYSSTYVPSYIAYGWGQNTYGQLGDGTSGFTESRISPVTVVGGITNWSQLSPGQHHNIGLTSTGIAYAWGRNNYGQLGDGTTTNRSSPVTVIGGITNWSQLDAGTYRHSLGVTSAGIAYAWGRNNYGQLGTGDTSIGRSSPVTVIGGINNWSQLAGGQFHSLGVTATGIAYAWGRNQYGQLGTGDKTSRLSPVTVIGGITNWSQVRAGGQFSIGLTSTGIAYAWGSNNFGALGDGTTALSSISPVTVVGGITNWSQLDASGVHNLGLTSTGILYAWGRNSLGTLGDGTTTNRSSPVTVIGGITNWSQLSAGGHSLGVTSTGIAYAWGSNYYGRLGDGTLTSRSSPVTVVGGITNWSQLRAGAGHSLGLALITKGF